MASSVSVAFIEIKLSVVDLISELDEVSCSSFDPWCFWNRLDQRNVNFIQILRVHNGDHIRRFNERKAEGRFHHLRLKDSHLRRSSLLED